MKNEKPPFRVVIHEVENGFVIFEETDGPHQHWKSKWVATTIEGVGKLLNDLFRDRLELEKK